MTGEIFPNDVEKFVTHVKTHVTSTISIDSLGGDLVAALRMAEVTRTLQLQIMVPKGKNCVSACFFLFLAGNGRIAAGADNGQRNYSMPLGYVGLHRPYLHSISNTEGSQAVQSGVMKTVAAYLEDQMVPRRLIDLMMSRPSNDVYWLTDEDLNELGDYPPAQEELYISKCGYDRHLSENLGRAKRVGDSSLVSKLNARLKCISNLQTEAYYRGISKLKAGWVPAKKSIF